MRFVQVTVPTGKREAIRRALDEEGIDYVMTEETSGRDVAAILEFPLPQNAVEPVMDRLSEAGLDDDAYTIVLEANTVVSRRFEELQDRYAETDGDEDRIARAELRTAANDLMPTMRNYLVLTTISAVVATAGLLLNSSAVVVGSMVIAPLVGPALAASVGTVIDDHEMRVRGVVLQAVGVLAAIASAAAFAAGVQFANLVPPGMDVLTIPEVRERLAPDFLALAIALGAGVAGALSLSTGVSAALVGVMIAVALIPPAAVVGIGLAWGELMLAAGASVLVLVNVLSINFSALAVLWYQGYRPGSWFRVADVRSRLLVRVGVLAAVILALSVFLGVVTVASYQASVAEERITSEIDAALEDYEELSLLEVQVEQSDNPIRGTPQGVIVTVGKPAGVDSPPLAANLRSRIDRAVGPDVTVEVRIVEIQRIGDEESGRGDGITANRQSS